ncbi:hypothetical protein HPB49_007905 [Dermacentor silvarum]|uniref:Uncharacterized protein n=1 Tax=Dermacentor silvarum TaxID=543639 RepID=A0ACB8DN48_DERSI|nr:hypothetical protein HPB49_007905 [Dermacentor silvarum]
MATDSEHEVDRPGVPHPRATTPSAAGDCRATPSDPMAIVRTGCLPMSAPSGRHGWPASFMDQGRLVTVGSPSTPPEYYVPRATARRPPTNRVARAAPAALESSRDRQPKLMKDTHTVPLQDGTVSPMQYCLIGLLLAGLCVAAALVVVDAPEGHDVRPRAEHHEIRPRMPAYDPHDEVDREAVVVILRPVEQPSPVVQGPTVFEPLPKPGNSVDATVAAKDHAAQDAITTGASVIQGRGRHDCNQYNYTYCTRPTANGFNYNRKHRACVPTTTPRVQLCNRGMNRFSSWERCRANCLQPGRVSDMCFERALFIPRSRPTYCTRPTANGFNYDREHRACVPTTTPRAQLCNRGMNRFSSWERCRANCLQPGRVPDMCFDRALFIPCSRQDFVDLMWYYNGTTCTKWTFLNGLCPAGQRAVYGAFDQCSRHCLVHNWTSNSNSTDCEVPPSGACSLEQLRYPFFADTQAEGRERCINASGVTLLARRCLVGNNQFESLKACQKACMEETVSFGTQLPPVQ